MTEMYIAYGVDPKQASILKDLEDLIGKPIPKVNSIEKFTFGAKVVNNNVIGLGLYFRGLKKLPASIGNLHLLEELNLNNNKLVTLPDAVSNLKYLKTLSVSRNFLDSLPDSFGNLETVTIFTENLNSESFKNAYKENFALIEELQQEYEDKEISFKKFISELLRIVEKKY